MLGEDIVDRVDSIIHEETQVHEYGVDVTIAAVYEVAERGHLDFGGDEFADADLRPLASALRDADDEYEWWTLKAGTYLIEFNESLREGAPLRVQIRRELRENGAYHPSIVTTELGLMPLTVPEGGVEFKENARVSTLMER